MIYMLSMTHERVGRGERSEDSPFDKAIDRSLQAIGIEPEAVSVFLASHPKGTRIAANTVSLTRIVLGEMVIRGYEHAKEADNKKQMALYAGALGLVMSTDFMDGYLCRRGGISDSKSGKIIDSVADIYFRARLARSPALAQKLDLIDKTRLAGEVLVATSAVPDILHAEYSSTPIGKTKVVADAGIVTSRIIGNFATDGSKVDRSLQVLNSVARGIGAGLAIADGINRGREKLLFHRHRF